MWGPVVASKEAGDAMSVDTGSGAEAGVAWGSSLADQATTLTAARPLEQLHCSVHRIPIGRGPKN